MSNFVRAHPAPWWWKAGVTDLRDMHILLFYFPAHSVTLWQETCVAAISCIWSGPEAALASKHAQKQRHKHSLSICWKVRVCVRVCPRSRHLNRVLFLIRLRVPMKAPQYRKRCVTPQTSSHFWWTHDVDGIGRAAFNPKNQSGWMLEAVLCSFGSAKVCTVHVES